MSTNHLGGYSSYFDRAMFEWGIYHACFQGTWGKNPTPTSNVAKYGAWLTAKFSTVHPAKNEQQIHVRGFCGMRGSFTTTKQNLSVCCIAFRVWKLPKMSHYTS